MSNDRSCVEYRALIELALKEIAEHNSERKYVTGTDTINRLRSAAGIPAIEPSQPRLRKSGYYG